MKFVNADALKNLISSYAGVWTDEGFMVEINAVLNGIDFMPDAVVHCKDCMLHGECMTEDAFHWSSIRDPYCAAGKRKDGE